MEKYVVKPNLRMYAVYEVTGEQKEVIEDFSETGEDGSTIKIVQELNGLVLTSERTSTYKIPKMEFPVSETVKEEITLSKGTKLVYVKYRGYVIPEVSLCTLEEAIKDLEVLKEV